MTAMLPLFCPSKIIREIPGTTRDQAENMVRVAPHLILSQQPTLLTNTLAGLESLVRSSSKLAGRKWCSFLSGGFSSTKTTPTRSNAYGASPVRRPQRCGDFIQWTPRLVASLTDAAAMLRSIRPVVLSGPRGETACSQER